MKIKELLQMDMEAASPIYLKMAQYAAEQCTGCSDSPMILAFKAQQAMLEAHERGEDSIQRLNAFLGTSIPEGVLLNYANKIHKFMKYQKALWQFVAYLFWPQKTDKTRYDNQG